MAKNRIKKLLVCCMAVSMVGTSAAFAEEIPEVQNDVIDLVIAVDTPDYDATITTEEVIFEENISDNTTDLNYVSSDAVPDETNDLITENASAADLQNGQLQEVEGYVYVYAGSGNTSQIRPAVVFTEALTDEQKAEKFGDHVQSGAYITDSFYTNHFINQLDEEYRNTIAVNDDGSYVTDAQGYVLDVNNNRVFKNEKTVVGPDGETYYLHRFDNLGNSMKIEGWYQDGEWVEELNGDGNRYAVVYAAAQQFVLVDQNTGETSSVYCADISTHTQDNFGYNIENLEDADYYTDEQAEKIRTIAANGYWGSGEDEAGNLEAMKEMLRSAVDENGSRLFTDEEIDGSLTDGVALTATQMAIWSCSNNMEGTEFVNAHYVGKPEDLSTDLYGAGALGDVPEVKEDEIKLMFKLYEYLKNLKPTPVTNTTADTIINQDNFIKDMSVTVVDKADTHVNNYDADDTNDAYVTNLTFALVVTPSTENGDDLIVKVLDANGNSIAEGRIAGQAQEGETVLTADTEGNYTFSGITMVEGDQNFNITLEGVQNLAEGVYLYTSEIRTDEEGDQTSSQTMVGLASGQHDVSVEMNIRFNLDVEDKVVAEEYYWYPDDIYTPDPEPEPTPEPAAEPPAEDIPAVEIPEEEVPLAEIPEEEVPLADVPKTGDNLTLWMAILALSVSGLAALKLTGRKYEN